MRGPGSFLSPGGLQKSDPYVLADGNTGLSDSVFTAAVGFNGNIVATVIAAQSTPVRIGNGAPSHTLFNGEAVTERFTIAGSETQDQEITYDGLLTRTFHIVFTCELDKLGGGSLIGELCIARDNVSISNSVTETEITNSATLAQCETTLTLDPGDTIQLLIGNNTSDANNAVKSGKWSIRRIT
jgi:hypothetical protein